MINKKVQDFLENFDAKTMKQLTHNNKVLTDILGKANSKIIRDILLNARDYHNSIIVSTLNTLTDDDIFVINQLQLIGYNIKQEKEITKFGECTTLTIKL